MVLAEREAKKHWPYCNHPQYRDDAIAVVVQISEPHMEICWISYSLKWAQDRGLVEGFPPIQTLSVCAIVTANAQVLVGKRAPQLLSFPNRWEFAPAGGVDRSAYEGGHVNLERQVLREWSEEVSPNTHPILTIEWCGLVYCSASSTWVGQFHIASAHFDPPPNEEVAMWRWEPRDQLVEELSATPQSWVPCSDILLARSGGNAK